MIHNSIIIFWTSLIVFLSKIVSINCLDEQNRIWILSDKMLYNCSVSLDLISSYNFSLVSVNLEQNSFLIQVTLLYSNNDYLHIQYTIVYAIHYTDTMHYTTYYTIHYMMYTLYYILYTSLNNINYILYTTLWYTVYFLRYKIYWSRNIRMTRIRWME